MRRRIISNIADWRIIRHFLKAPLPQWVVLVGDILIVFFSALITILLGHGDPTAGFPGWIFDWPTRAGVVVAVYAFIFCLVKPYRSIIRLSAIEDTYPGQPHQKTRKIYDLGITRVLAYVYI